MKEIGVADFFKKSYFQLPTSGIQNACHCLVLKDPGP